VAALALGCAKAAKLEISSSKLSCLSVSFVVATTGYPPLTPSSPRTGGVAALALGSAKAAKFEIFSSKLSFLLK
jgi:hypothetical protein